MEVVNVAQGQVKGDVNKGGWESLMEWSGLIEEK